ncbi:hypothetical protein [Adhaeribacter aquaticus]|uniref:hypothetical protein n=1 Tax=Adhaeribacter aquaticus TaxID=299567 RepID=UPI0003F9B685|nr:hypothetical protein [Adhaeribacter aquaticus]
MRYWLVGHSFPKRADFLKIISSTFPANLLFAYLQTGSFIILWYDKAQIRNWPGNGVQLWVPAMLYHLHNDYLHVYATD